MKEQRLCEVLRTLKTKCLLPTVDTASGFREWKTLTHWYVVTRDNEIVMYADGEHAKEFDCIQSVCGHSGAVLDISFSPDGRRIASASADKRVIVWQDGQWCQTLVGHAESVNCVAFSPDGKCIVSGADDGTIKLWSLQDPLKFQAKPRSSVTAIAVSTGPNQFASVHSDGTVNLWHQDQCTSSVSLPFVEWMSFYTDSIVIGV
eukprot:ANDGO_00390.mRNA.1 putative WD repeat-containing protein alr2800